jgi:predicted CXXCH cytochrome family protein
LDIANKKVKHVPAFDGNCHTCHDPHQSDLAYFLKEEKSKLCVSCHENIKIEAALPNIHPPFSDDCANCHSTHGSDNEKLLTEKSPVLCFTCHTNLQSDIENSTVIHKAISESKGCANCHSPHASNQKSYLVSEEKELCLSCHNENIQTEKGILQNIGKMLKKGNFVHGAIKNDGCVICHDPHNSKNSLLLPEPYPSGQYTDGKSENFALCFSCHESGLMENKVDSTITNFRNGNQNLHFIHLSGNKGHNCNICHNIHGSVFDYLISNKVKFGKWEMPLKYIKEENGGTCNTGCHEDKKYLR